MRLTRSIVLILGLILFIPSSYAAVWASKYQWSTKFEQAYQEWIQKSIQLDIFTNPESPYYGISTDCADLVYALRIIFSYENGLPFTAVDSSLSKGSQLIYVTEKSSKFNKIAVGIPRVKAFIKYISDVNGTQSLAKFDTYPVALKSIKSGDIYLAEWQTQEGYEVNHSYVVRDVSPYGYFEFFYSSTPSLVRKLIQLSGMPSMFITGEPWGFRRFKWPQHYTGSVKLANYSKEQYSYALVHKEEFFNFLQKLIQTEPEPIDSIFKRRLSNICSQLISRVEVVSEAQKYIAQNGGRCLNKKEFSLYSTTSRDKTILFHLDDLIRLWKEYVFQGGYQDSSYSIQLSLDYLSGLDNSLTAREQLQKQCAFEIKELPDYGIREFMHAYQQSRVSSHPNSTALARWGAEAPTQCESYY